MILFTRFYSAILITLLITLQITHSQEYSKIDSFKTYYIDPIVITGTRTGVFRNSLPLSISVISEYEIRQSGDPSLLSLIGSRIPGVFVTKRSLLGFGLAQGSAGQITIRGTGGNPNTEVLILLDGRPQFMGLMGHPLPDNYISSNVERVEVLKGPCSFLYGSNAMGGAINIITKRQKKDGFSVNLSQSYGTYSTLIGDAGIGYKSGKFDMFVSASNQKSNGNRPYSDFQLNNGFSRIGYSINKNFDLSIDANLTKFKTYDPGTIYKPLVNNWVDILRGNAGFSFENKFTKTDGALKMIYNYGKHSVYDGYRSEDRNISITAYQSAKFFSGNILSLGFDYKNYGGNANNIITLKNWDEHYVNETAAYIHTQQTLIKKITFNGGLRIEHNSIFGNELLPEIGIAYDLQRKTILRASVSKGFRSPTIRELYLFPAPTPDLKPERMWNYEIGLLNNSIANLSLELSIFLAKGENLIMTEGVYPNLSYSNSGSFEKKGFEVSIKYNPINDLTFNTNYAFIDPDQQTISTPRHKFYLETAFRYKFLRFSASTEYVSNIYGDNFSRKQLDDYTILSAKLNLYPAENFSFFIECANLLDKEYQLIYGYPMPKATYNAGINYNY